MKCKCVREYYDIQLLKTIKVGKVTNYQDARAKELITKGYVVEVKKKDN